MKLNGFTYLILSGLLLVASSCSDINTGKQLRTIQKLQNQLIKNENLIKKIPSQEFEEIHSYFTFHLQKIGDTIEGKSISKKSAMLLDSCKYIIHELNEFNQLGVFLDSNTTLSQFRLNALKHDILEQTGNRKKYDDYIAIERNQVAYLTSISTTLLTSSEEIRELAERLATNLNDLTIHFKKP